MRSSHIKNLDSASEYITNLQSLLQKPRVLQKDFEMDLFQQYLDEESLYIKQIPHVRPYATI